MWLLLACADGAPDGKDAVRDDTDTAAPDGDTADTGDTGNANERCQGPATVLDVPVGGRLSPYATLLTTDLDGGGLPDVLHERWDGRRGVALLRGEDLVLGRTDPAAWVPTLGDTEQAALILGEAGDLDGDGFPEVLVAEADEPYAESLLSAWSLARPDAPLATLAVALRGPSSFLMPAVSAADDIDGDGVPEVVAITTSPAAPEHATLVFSGAAVADGAFDVSAPMFSVSSPLRLTAQPAASEDLDGDGLGDVTFSQHGVEWENVMFLPGSLVSGGGVVDTADLDVLLADVEPMLPRFVDIDLDGFPEVYAGDYSNGNYLVRGYAGDQVAAAARTGTALGQADASVTIEGSGSDYFGARIVPVTDAACKPGIAISAHFADRVYLAGNDVLVAGGRLDTGDLAALDGTGWFGYSLGGGQDLDQDGALDLAIGNSEEALSVYLNPAALADPP